MEQSESLSLWSSAPGASVAHSDYSDLFSEVVRSPYRCQATAGSQLESTYTVGQVASLELTHVKGQRTQVWAPRVLPLALQLPLDPSGVSISAKGGYRKVDTGLPE